MNKILKWLLWCIATASAILSGGFSGFIVYQASKTPQSWFGMTVVISFFTTSLICLGLLFFVVRNTKKEVKL